MIDGANPKNEEDCCSEQNEYKEEVTFHAKLLECIHDGILAFDKDFVITYWNMLAEDIFVWPAQELIGRKVQELYHTAVPDYHWERSLQKLYSKELIKGEYSVLRKNGQMIYIDVNMKVLKDKQGLCNGAVATFRDITKRKEYERELSESKVQDELNKQRLKTIIDVCPSAIVLVDAKDKKITYVNRRAAELYRFDYTGIDLNIHVADIEILRPDGTPYPIEELPVSRALNYGEYVRNRDMIIKNREGNRIHLTVSAAPLNNAAGELSEVLVIFEDISEQKKFKKRWINLTMI